MDLGYSSIGDYAREELGLNASTAVKMARLARKLRDRPLVCEAVRRGEITPRKAEIIAPVAVGPDQARWISWRRATPSVPSELASRHRRTRETRRGSTSPRRSRRSNGPCSTKR
jgi:hypothetical protein